MKVILITIPINCMPKHTAPEMYKALKERGYDAMMLFITAPFGTPIQVFDLDKLTPIEVEEVRKLTEASLVHE